MIVRLKDNEDRKAAQFATFQFYDSPIKSRNRHSQPRGIVRFNSMIVRLKVFWTVRGYNPVEGGFNSMIVRLKVRLPYLPERPSVVVSIL